MQCRKNRQFQELKNVFSVCVWKTQFYSNQKIGKTLPRYVTLVAIKNHTWHKKYFLCCQKLGQGHVTCQKILWSKTFTFRKSLVRKRVPSHTVSDHHSYSIFKILHWKTMTSLIKCDDVINCKPLNIIISFSNWKVCSYPDLGYFRSNLN